VSASHALRVALVVAPTFAWSLGCARGAVPCASQRPTAGETVCATPGYDDRDYIVHLPPAYDGTTKLPVVLAFHGGAGKKESMNRVTCRAGEAGAASCLSSAADAAGVIVIYPDGTPALLGALRTWNAGGGVGELRCASGPACKEGVDDIAYVRALLADVKAAVSVDEARVYATGLSNGAAMSHRLACEMAGDFAAIGAVAGGNQAAFAQGCAPSRPVPVMVIHGTNDPCWGYEGGVGACLQQDGKRYVSVRETLLGDDTHPGWVQRNGCGLTPRVEELPDATADGTRVYRELYEECREGATVELLRVEGGGHSWPGGYPYFGEERIGKVSTDIDASSELLRFFAAHPRP
jgi:polyhydroxybutyrate depolymerase